MQVCDMVRDSRGFDCLLIQAFASLRGYWWKECIIWSLHSVKVTSSCNINFGLCLLVFMVRSPTVFIGPTLWLWITYFFSPSTFHNFRKKLFLLKKSYGPKNIFLVPSPPIRLSYFYFRLLFFFLMKMQRHWSGLVVGVVLVISFCFT